MRHKPELHWQAVQELETAIKTGFVQELQGAVQHFWLQGQIGKHLSLCCPQGDLRQLVIINVSPAHGNQTLEYRSDHIRVSPEMACHML